MTEGTVLSVNRYRKEVMAVKIQKPDYWPALTEGEKLAGIQREQDAKRRSIINKEDCIRIRGANEHNLKNLTLEIPRNELVVLTGLSGSGKSSLAFDTIYAEGQRRYMESLSSYARQSRGFLLPSLSTRSPRTGIPGRRWEP